MDIGQRELSAGDIATDAFRAWFSNFAQVFVISLIFTVPIFIVNALLFSGLPESANELDDFDIGNFLARSIGGSIVSIILSVVLTAALAYAFMKIYRGEPVVPADAGQAVLDHIGAILIFAVLTSIITAIGLLLLIIPGIAAIIAFSLGAPAILNERISGTGAISRCFNLIAGNWGVAIGVVLIGLIVNIVVSLIVGGIATPGSFSNPTFSDFNFFRTLAQIVASALVAPLIPALATALYFEVKGRDEGFPSL